MAVPPSASTSSGSARQRPSEIHEPASTTKLAAVRAWNEPPNGPKMPMKPECRVPVVYYLSRNGQLEHPHFMEVPLISSPHHGLFLRDVINRLNAIRGKGMASMYSWSCKRSYKNGFVWHDLSENDFIHPAHGHHEYVLKGSLLPGNALLDTVTISQPPETRISGGGDTDCPRPADRRRRNQSCSSIDFNPDEYSVYKADSTGITAAAAANASTQTDDNRRSRRRRPPPEIVELKELEKGKAPCENEPESDEIEISPPPSDSSPETLETLMKADRRLMLRPETVAEDPAADGYHHHNHKGGKSSVLMQLISCGSISFRDCGAGQGLGLISQQYKMRLPRGGGGKVKLEGKEYFSGSLVETKKEEFPALKLKRSTSYNADRSLRLELQEKEIDGVRAKCIPRNPKSQQSFINRKSEGLNDLSCNISTTNSCT